MLTRSKKSFVALLACFACTGFVQGQIANLTSSTDLVSSVLQQKAQLFASSKSLFAAHQFSAAAATLASGNVSSVGTAAWNIESATSLLRVAGSFRANGDSVTAIAAARLALAELLTANSLNGNDPAAKRANVEETLGYIYQAYLGDNTSAVQAYSQAVALSPTTGNAAATLAALKADLAEAAKKAGGQ